jgi:phosphate starvation-inducible PhoH-like protein
VEATRILRDIKGIGVINLSGEDVVRHKLVKQIIDAYDKSDAEKEAKS